MMIHEDADLIGIIHFGGRNTNRSFPVGVLAAFLKVIMQELLFDLKPRKPPKVRLCGVKCVPD